MKVGPNHSPVLINKIKSLRQQGWSYGEISKETKVSKSTLSYWLRDTPLKSEYRKRLYTKQILNLTFGSASSKVRRQKEIDYLVSTARKEIAGVSAESYKIAGVMMYWAEGSKSKGTAITNSDPKIVKFMVKWFNDICGWPPDRLRAHLHIHQQDNDTLIKKYWSRLTGIPLPNFGKTFIKPPGTGHRKNRLANGIIRIRATGKGSDNLRRKILAWKDEIFDTVVNRL